MKFKPASPEFQFHILRHFRHCTEEYLQDLAIKANKDLSEIKNQMEIKGSYFHPAFTGNPASLYDFVISEIRKRKLHPKQQDNSLHFRLIFSESEYPHGIGSDGLCALSDLSDDEKQNIYWSDRAGTRVMMVQSKMHPSRQLHLLCNKTKEGYEPLTIFPGTYAPPLPNPKYLEGENLQNAKDFWNQHVFIVE